jgi:hypothetical protein
MLATSPRARQPTYSECRNGSAGARSYLATTCEIASRDHSRIPEISWGGSRRSTSPQTATWICTGRRDAAAACRLTGCRLFAKRVRRWARLCHHGLPRFRAIMADVRQKLALDPTNQV